MSLSLDELRLESARGADRHCSPSFREGSHSRKLAVAKSVPTPSFELPGPAGHTRNTPVRREKASCAARIRYNLWRLATPQFPENFAGSSVASPVSSVAAQSSCHALSMWRRIELGIFPVNP